MTVSLNIFREAPFPAFQEFVEVFLRDFTGLLKRMPKSQVCENRRRKVASRSMLSVTGQARA